VLTQRLRSDYAQLLWVCLVESQEKCDILASARPRPPAKSHRLNLPPTPRHLTRRLGCVHRSEKKRQKIEYRRGAWSVFMEVGVDYELSVMATESTQINLYISSVSFEVSHNDRRFQVDIFTHSVSDIQSTQLLLTQGDPKLSHVLGKLIVSFQLIALIMQKQRLFLSVKISSKATNFSPRLDRIPVRNFAIPIFLKCNLNLMKGENPLKLVVFALTSHNINACMPCMPKYEWK